MNKYKLLKVPGFKRILIRIFDFLIVSIVLFIFFVLINIDNYKIWNQELFHSHNQKIIISEPWIFHLQIFFAIFFSFAYFILIPYFYNGQTLGKKIANIKVIDLNTLEKPSFLSILKRETFIIIFPLFCIFLIYLLLIINHDYSLSFFNSSLKPKFLNSLFTTLYYASNSITFFLVIFLLISNSYDGLHDKLSKTAVVYKKEFKVKLKNNNLNEKNLFFTNKKIDQLNDLIDD